MKKIFLRNLELLCRAFHCVCSDGYVHLVEYFISKGENDFLLNQSNETFSRSWNCTRIFDNSLKMISFEISLGKFWMRKHFLIDRIFIEEIEKSEQIYFDCNWKYLLFYDQDSNDHDPKNFKGMELSSIETFVLIKWRILSWKWTLLIQSSNGRKSSIGWENQLDSLSRFIKQKFSLFF